MTQQPPHDPDKAGQAPAKPKGGLQGGPLPTSANPEKERAALLHDYHTSEPRYRVLEQIGQGGFGEVMSCFDRFAHRLVARKSLKDKHRDNTAQLRALINESRLVSYLEHPGIVPLYDVLVDSEGKFAYTMKHIEGEPLSEWLKQHALRRQPFPTSWCMRIFTKLSETLSYAHDRGVLHLDIKPANVMLGTYGEVLILDWGSARLYQPERYENHLRTISQRDEIQPIVNLDDRLVGTPPYLSPEQVQGFKDKLTPATDVFCAGVLLYQMLSGASPYSTRSVQEFVDEVLHKDPVPIHERRADVPVRLSRIGMKMLARDPKERYSNFREVLQELQDFNSQGSGFEVRTYDAGEIIFHEGEEGDHAFQIIDGQVEIITTVEGETKVLAQQGRGDIIGELAVFTKRPRTATVRALTPTTVQLLTADNINKELEKLHPWVGDMIFKLSKKFIDLNQQLAKPEPR
ncbi:MAG: cyclic nucleotide-binding domain-containing protein [Deltaproteobacteria bacterium]|nr:MAG: cyclic nucleotide-binding domain-containing protein [Deltaproteobacteria bacterium]